jgi:hypothetical protein
MRYAAAISRRIAALFTELADYLDSPSAPSAPLEPAPDSLSPDAQVFELRHRLSRYY